MTWHKAVWRKGKKTITGKWAHDWAADRFHIRLASLDEITGRTRELFVSGDKPDFNGWKRDESRATAS